MRCSLMDFVNLLAEKWIWRTDRCFRRHAGSPQKRTLAENDVYILFVLFPHTWNVKVEHGESGKGTEHAPYSFPHHR